MPAKVPRAANSSSSNMNFIKADIKDICKKLQINVTFKHLRNEAYLEDILIQISSVSNVSLPTGALKRIDLQAFIKKVYRNKNLATRVRRSKYVAFSDSRPSAENTPYNQAQDANLSVQGEQSMEVSNGVAKELHVEGSAVVSVDYWMDFLDHALTELKMG